MDVDGKQAVAEIAALEAQIADVMKLCDKWDEIAGVATYMYSFPADRLKLIFQGAVDDGVRSKYEKKIEKLNALIEDLRRSKQSLYREAALKTNLLSGVDVRWLRTAIRDFNRAIDSVDLYQIKTAEEQAAEAERADIWCSE